MPCCGCLFSDNWWREQSTCPWSQILVAAGSWGPCAAPRPGPLPVPFPSPGLPSPSHQHGWAFGFPLTSRVQQIWSHSSAVSREGVTHLGPGSRPAETMGQEPWFGGTAPSRRGTPADRAGPWCPLWPQRGHADEGAEKSKHLPGASFPPVLFSAFGSSAVGAACPVAGAALLPRVTSRAGLDPQPARHHSGGRGAHAPWWGLVYFGPPL